MLQVIRDKTSGWIAYLIIALISIPFALWGINSYLGGGAEKPAAIVNGDEITPRQLDQAYARYRDQLAQVFGGRIPAAFNDENALKEQALTQLIEQKILTDYIRDKGYRVGNKKLFDEIQAMGVFQKNGKFDRETYQNQLASQGYNPAYFEQQLRQTSEMQQLNKAIKASAFTVPAEIKKLDQLENEERKVRTLNFKNQAETVSVSDQEIKDYYNKNTGLYMNPEKLKVDYIELSVDKMAQNISVTEDQIQEKFDQMHDTLTTPETRNASHILLTVGKDADDKSIKKQLIELKKRIENGEDFAELAKKYSQDPGSASDGGELGDISKGDMVAPFEKVLFGMKPGEISDPVKTQFGWHLIKLNSIQGGKEKTLDDVRADIVKELKTEKAESQIYDLAENLASIAYEEPSSLAPAAEQLGLKIETSDWFTRSKGAGIAAEEKVRQAAFSDEVLNQKINSEEIELSDNRVVFIHLKAHQPAARKPLSEVHDLILKALKKKKGQELAQSEGEKALAQLKSGAKTMDELASELSLTVQDDGYIKRNNKKVSRDILNAVFVLPRPENGKPVYDGLSRSNGDYSVIELSDVRIAKADKKKKSEKDLADKINKAKANYEYQALIKTLTSEAEIIRTPVKELQ